MLIENRLIYLETQNEQNAMPIEQVEQSNKDAVVALQSQLNFKLPTDYLDFLSINNGARVIDGFFYVEDLKEFILMDIFYGVTTSKSINLQAVNDEFGDDIPPKSLLIGEDPGGAFILLVNNEGSDNNIQDGIYFYDHAYFFYSSTDENNTYLICKTFTEFIRLLESTKGK